MRNIGISFVKMGQFPDAITSFESIMEINPDYHTGNVSKFIKPFTYTLIQALIWYCVTLLLETAIE